MPPTPHLPAAGPADSPELPAAGALQLAGVGVTYPRGPAALLPTDLQVHRGEFLVLLGASGAGKSTLLRCLNGLVQPTTGEIRVPGLPGGRLQPHTLRAHRRQCAMVFQQHHLIGRQRVLDNVLKGRLAHHGSLATLLPWRRADKCLALAEIDRVGLLDKALARADTLSGGQQQRVGLARALVQRPRLLLADEPVASLDPATALAVLELLHRICRQDQLTAVVSLHQVALARRFADRIVGLRAGRVVFDGRPAELTAEVEAALYATSPATAATGATPAPTAAAPRPVAA